jgi:hypothetical protein
MRHDHLLSGMLATAQRRVTHQRAGELDLRGKAFIDGGDNLRLEGRIEISGHDVHCAAFLSAR